MDIKVKISKKTWLRLAIFVAVIGVATLFDVYLENNPESLKDIQQESADNSRRHAKIYFVGQSSIIDFKTASQKDASKKLKVKSHDKHIQKYHQLRNFQVLKAEITTQTAPLILSYHYLVFQNYFFSDPDGEPLRS